MRPEELAVIIDNLRQGMNPEGPYLEIKRKWGDFSNKKFKEEFIKDLVALANTYGDRNRHLIYGLEDKKILDAPLPTDESNVQQLLHSNVDPPFSFEVREHKVEDKTITVLTIFKSDNRPHIVKEHNKRESCIFVRRGSTIAFANRNELDEMYSEREKRDSPDLGCEISSDGAHYGDHRIKNYTVMGIPLYILVSNRGGVRTTIKTLSVSLDGLDIPISRIVNQREEVQELPIPIDEGEGKGLRIYLSLKNLMDKQQSVGSKEIILTIQDIHGNEILAQKTIDIR